MQVPEVLVNVKAPEPDPPDPTSERVPPYTTVAETKLRSACAASDVVAGAAAEPPT